MDKLLVRLVQDDTLLEKILDEMYPKEVFEDNIRKEKSLKDIKWTLLFIVEAIKADNVKIIDNYFIWLGKLFKGLNLSYDNIPLLLNSIKTVLGNEYGNKEIMEFLDRVSLKQQKEESVVSVNPFKEEKERYLEALLSSNRSEAEQVVKGLIDKGTPIEYIYIYIFQDAMRDVGGLWHEGKISVGREHYCTAVTQYIMSTLYSYIFNDVPKEKRLMACAVGSELHEMGIRMVADLFELSGWDTNYLGANLPSSEIISFAREYKPNVIALSITMPYHISLLSKVVEDIRSYEDLKEVKIIVGGLPFINNQELNNYVKADAVAVNAIEGVKIANNF